MLTHISHVSLQRGCCVVDKTGARDLSDTRCSATMGVVLQDPRNYRLLCR
jgi:hypothetical protein